MVMYGEPGAVSWVESLGGPLVVVPEAVLGAWSGSAGDDYDRACAVEGFIGLIEVGSAQALVLGDEPASTAYLSVQNVFVRWSAAESEEAMLASVEAAVRAASWESELLWQVPGPVVLFDSAWTGAECHHQDHVRVALEAGPYAVRAAYVEPDPETWLTLVQLRPLQA
ncbi:immunity protein 21 of polymorphic toxin system [Streptomyces sp. TLI_235]|nr:Imm21 family immunity protein [Streptomyces sp. TLI_235]PBC66254.1 immunity protein 21 of polymorphic toxin system [Streptomyces sp. TLI_235]